MNLSLSKAVSVLTLAHCMLFTGESNVVMRTNFDSALASVMNVKLSNAIPKCQNLLSLNGNITSLTSCTSTGLMNHDAGVWKRNSVARLASR